MWFDGINVMKHLMKFWNVEVFMYAFLNEDIFVLVESFKHFLKGIKGSSGLYIKL